MRLVQSEHNNLRFVQNLIGSLRQFCDSQKEGEKYVFLRRPAPFFTKVVDWGISK